MQPENGRQNLQVIATHKTPPQCGQTHRGNPPLLKGGVPKTKLGYFLSMANHTNSTGVSKLMLLVLSVCAALFFAAGVFTATMLHGSTAGTKHDCLMRAAAMPTIPGVHNANDACEEKFK